MFRSTANVGDDPGYCFAVLGSHNPGRIAWASDVFDMAAMYRLVLPNNADFIDTVAGQTGPEGAMPMRRTTREQVATTWVLMDQEAKSFVSRHSPADAAITGEKVPLADGPGFTLETIVQGAGGTGLTRAHDRAHFLSDYAGTATLNRVRGTPDRGAGSTMSVPSGLPYWLTSDVGATDFAVGP